MHIHFETSATAPDVFRITQERIDAALTRAGMQVHATLGIDLADLSPLASANALVTSNGLIRDPVFPCTSLATAAPNLKCIHVIAAGIEPLLPLDWLPPGVSLTNNSGVHFDKAVESATMVLLLLHARLPAIVTNQRNGRWDQIFTPTIRGKTALVIGVGDMGGAVATAAKALGLHVVGVRRSGAPHPGVDTMLTPDALDDALPAADFVVLATPHTPETANLMSRARFRRMKQGAGFFNYGRGACIDQEALVDALESGHLSGAVVDVVDREPLEADSPLWHVRNLIVTPHVTSDDADQYVPRTLDLVFSNLRRLQEGLPLLNRVDPLKGY
jgi:phosphoglycerate dehydrogenase-like enzyme